GVAERLRDVRRQGRLAMRLALETQTPASLPEMLEELDRAVAATGLEAAGRAREAFPEVVLEPLEQEHLPARRLDRDASRDDLRVVDDDELVVKLVGEIGELAMPHVAGRSVVDEQPRRVSPRRRVLCDQLR